jgi:exodeoxyribonuclease III
MRVATWNVNSVGARLPRLVSWVGETSPDILCLQETKCVGDQFPADALRPYGYEVIAHGDGRWNGVAVASRVGIEDVALGLVDEPGFPDPEARAVGTTCGGVRVWSVYVPNGREPGHPHYHYKLAWLDALRATVAADLAAVPDRPLAVMGDFNVAPTDEDVWDPEVFAHATHVTPAERAALAQLRGEGLRDVVPRPLKGPHPFTYWDYRAGAFHKNLGMRIDLVLANEAFARGVRDAYVDREARKGKGPSDHAPVVVDLDI